MLRPWLIESSLIVRFYVITLMRDAVLINYHLSLHKENFVQKLEKNGKTKRRGLGFTPTIKKSHIR